VRSIAISVFVCLYVDLSVFAHISKMACPTFTKFPQDANQLCYLYGVSVMCMNFSELTCAVYEHFRTSTMWFFFFLYCVHYCDVEVLVVVFVCLSVCFFNLCCILSSWRINVHIIVAVARSSSDDMAICYLLPVLWMTSCFLITEPMTQDQNGRPFFVEFFRWRHRGRNCCLRLQAWRITYLC